MDKNYDQIMDAAIKAEIQQQILDRFQPPITINNTHQPLPNRRTPPPQDWIMRLRSRLDQQIRLFLSIINNPESPTHSTPLPTSVTESTGPPIIQHLRNGLYTYRSLFRPLLQFKESHPKLIYRTAKFLITCHGFIWMLDTTIDKNTTNTDMDPGWLFFISLAYAIIDDQVDSYNNSELDGNIQTHELFEHLDTLFNQTPLHLDNTDFDPLILHKVNRPEQYLDELWYSHVQQHPERVYSARRALECEKYSHQIQQLGRIHPTEIRPNIAADLLIEKAVSTIRLIYRPHRNAGIQTWRRLYWSATAIQLLDDLADASEDIQADLAGTTGLAICQGDLQLYTAGVLDTVSYIYYHYEIFAGEYERLAVLHQIGLYGIVKNLTTISRRHRTMASDNKGDIEGKGFSQDWISRCVIPKLVLDLETLYGLRSSKRELIQWLLYQLQ